jgi:hypothetical protein
VAQARKQARLETAGKTDGSVQGAFPGIWERKPTKDDENNPGEVQEYLPDWLDDWMHANSSDNPGQVEWEAEERKRSDEFGNEPYPMETAEDRQKREANEKWLAEVKRRQAVNAERMRNRQPPIPMPPHP